MLMLTWPGAKTELRYLPAYWMRAGVARVFDLEVWAYGQAHATVTLITSVADRVEVSTDGGLSYDPVGITPDTGVDLGALARDARTSIKVRCTPAAGVAEERYDLILGAGT